MHYKQSETIKTLLEKPKTIFINCHRSPDCDSIGSALALGEALETMGKTVSYMCPSPIPEAFTFLEGIEKVQTVNFDSIDFSQFDLAFFIDSSSEDQISDSKEFRLPNIPTIIIDHHVTNKLGADAVIVDPTASSTAEILYRVLEDLKLPITQTMATALFSAVETDSVSFRYARGPQTFDIAGKLVAEGADRKAFIQSFYNTLHIDVLTLLGKMLDRMELHAEHRFVYTAIPYGLYEEYGKHEETKEIMANMFIQSVKGADFGFVALEKEPGKVSVSFRSKADTDISGLAKSLGGGGHKNAAGAKIEGKFEEVLEKLVEAAKKLQNLNK